MFYVTIGAFAVFFVCCALQFLFRRRVVRALVERHPDVWQEMSGKAFFVPNLGLDFATERRDRGLGDPDLTRKVQQLRLLYLVGILCCLVIAGSLSLGLLR
jgi:hypothetical protein